MTAKKKSAPEPEAEPEAGVEEAPPAPVTTLTADGLRATDTFEDGSVVQREATFAEQVLANAPELLRLAIGTVPHAQGGTVECDGNVVTLTLSP